MAHSGYHFPRPQRTTSNIPPLPTMSKRVIPLESNPDIFNELAYKIGLSPILQFQDLYSLTDPDLLAFVPQPVYALILLFPLTKSYEAYREGLDTKSAAHRAPRDVAWFQQTIGNACGLYALLHVLANLPRDLIVRGLLVANLLAQLTPHTSDAETARLIENLEGAIQLDSNYGARGQTEAPPAATECELHFIAFIRSPHNNHVYELDGRRTGPVDLGVSIQESATPSILSEPAVVDKVQFYMNQADDHNKHNFLVMAVAPAL